ncbi:cysteine desulfurase family protein [Acidaminobacter hydrogenoformans]|uniref:Cysteine desulfurase n=1 Tax=Acidaminobacter hydrogenoformans DSM 2784 TaxID=1120920 RepID=A0A1G5RY30_9FIRM|nr:cysteine desulfurase family protein [Acidaminobacter hydrogenoformans]SCZ78660.1 cysteine desulfurase [Acidaminobacter hydrogenoformans DSM 2784]
MTENKIYMDNAAATRLDEAVFEAMTPCYFENYAVATSEFGYSQGLEARETLAEARAAIASVLGADPEEFIFTSGSTESSNLALKGVAKALGTKKGKHIIVSKIEDFPVLQSARALEKQGFEVDYLNVDDYGFVRLDQLESLLRPDTILVSVQHANHEIGTVQDLGTIGRLCSAKNVLFHTDATHTFTRLPLDVRRIKVDLITVSAHTLHGPKGIGGLYVRRGTPLEKIADGGFQEFNLRAGLENIPGAVGFAKAVSLVTEEENARLKDLRDQLIEQVVAKIPLVTLNGDPQKRTPQNANLSFHHVEGESITLHLDMYGIAVSTGSACFSRSLEASHVMMAIGGDHERAHGSIRFTFGRYNTMEEVDLVVETLAKIVENLRKISPLGKQGGV